MFNKSLTFLATAPFGVEGLVAAELRSLQMANVKGEIGGARFTGTIADAFLCNLRLHTADRVLMILAEGVCCQFEDLFQLVLSLPWAKILPTNASIHVSGKCVRSKLMSVRDCQAIAKKAIIEKLRLTTHNDFFPETGDTYNIGVSVYHDQARITLDTSGVALNKRGYRTWNGEAPIRETLAAALIELSPWKPGMPLHDPCCGTATIPIEAAFHLAHRGPGIARSFDCEHFEMFDTYSFRNIRSQVASEYEPNRISDIGGSDIDPEALKLAHRHVNQAGLNNLIELRCEPLEKLQIDKNNGVFICNPPYGERLSDRKSCAKLYRQLHELQQRHPSWSLCAISSDPSFERAYGKKADRKRRLYNGRLECEFLVFYP